MYYMSCENTLSLLASPFLYGASISLTTNSTLKIVSFMISPTCELATAINKVDIKNNRQL